MRYLLLGLCLLLPFLTLAQEEIQYKEYSYTELFQMIEEEEDTIFKLENAIIYFNEETDSQFVSQVGLEENFVLKPINPEQIIIDKAIELNNVQFTHPQIEEINGERYFKGTLNNIQFTKQVRILSTINLFLHSSEFLSGVYISKRGSSPKVWNRIKGHNRFSHLDHVSPGVYFSQNESFGEVTLTYFLEDEDKDSQGQLYVDTNTFSPSKRDSSPYEILIFGFGTSTYDISNNIFNPGAEILIIDNENQRTTINNNDFSTNYVEIRLLENERRSALDFTKNSFEGNVELNLNKIEQNYNLDFDQFDENMYASTGFINYLSTLPSSVVNGNDQSSDSLKLVYIDGGRTTSIEAFEAEVALRGKFYNHFKSIFNTRQANAVYINMKDIETERLQYEYQQEPHFNTFFKWKINQFLKVFSAYGTEPSRAVVFSVYVILAFALVYLFFPNYWDSHGRNRIMDRYRFFLKYVNKDSGMHEVYLDEKKPELLASEDFKVYLQEQGKTAPKFFMATALPLYRWSVAGTKSFSWLLSKVDVLKGKWSDTEDSKKGVKTVLLISAFLISLTYDIFIKMLNALMLSINTFTTLGFGEIPIKGLPRYLAIIQGFIGWFMLTIFSVSLISQLLN